MTTEQKVKAAATQMINHFRPISVVASAAAKAAGDLGPKTQTAGQRVKAALTSVVGNFQIVHTKAKEMAEKVKGHFEGIRDKVKGLLGALGPGTGLLGALGALSGVELLGNVIETTAKWGENVNNLSKALGTSTEKASDWVAVASHLGVETNALIQGLKPLNVLLDRHHDILDKMGLVYKDAAGKMLPMEQILQNVIAQLHATADDPNLKNRLSDVASTLLGRNWRQLLPLISKGIDYFNEIKKTAHDFGLELSRDQVNAIIKYNEKQKELQLMFTAMEVQLGLKLIPRMLELTKWIEEQGRQFEKHRGFVYRLKEAFVEFYNYGIKPAIEGYKALAKWIGNLFSPIQKLIGWFTGGHGASDSLKHAFELVAGYLLVGGVLYKALSMLGITSSASLVTGAIKGISRLIKMLVVGKGAASLEGAAVEAAGAKGVGGLMSGLSAFKTANWKSIFAPVLYWLWTIGKYASYAAVTIGAVTLGGSSPAPTQSKNPNAKDVTGGNLQPTGAFFTQVKGQKPQRIWRNPKTGQLFTQTFDGQLVELKPDGKGGYQERYFRGDETVPSDWYGIPTSQGARVTGNVNRQVRLPSPGTAARSADIQKLQHPRIPNEAISPTSATEWGNMQLIAKYAKKFGVPFRVAMILAWSESRLGTTSKSVTGYPFGGKVSTNEQEIAAGIWQLRQWYNKYGNWPAATVAYKAGNNRLDAAIASKSIAKWEELGAFNMYIYDGRTRVDTTIDSMFGSGTWAAMVRYYVNEYSSPAVTSPPGGGIAGVITNKQTVSPVFNPPPLYGPGVNAASQPGSTAAAAALANPYQAVTAGTGYVPPVGRYGTPSGHGYRETGADISEKDWTPVMLPLDAIYIGWDRVDVGKTTVAVGKTPVGTEAYIGRMFFYFPDNGYYVTLWHVFPLLSNQLRGWLIKAGTNVAMAAGGTVNWGGFGTYHSGGPHIEVNVSKIPMGDPTKTPGDVNLGHGAFDPMANRAWMVRAGKKPPLPKTVPKPKPKPKPDLPGLTTPTAPATGKTTRLTAADIRSQDWLDAQDAKLAADKPRKGFHASERYIRWYWLRWWYRVQVAHINYDAHIEQTTGYFTGSWGSNYTDHSGRLLRNKLRAAWQDAWASAVSSYQAQVTELVSSKFTVDANLQDYLSQKPTGDWTVQDIIGWWAIEEKTYAREVAQQVAEGKITPAQGRAMVARHERRAIAQRNAEIMASYRRQVAPVAQGALAGVGAIATAIGAGKGPDYWTARIKQLKAQRAAFVAKNRWMLKGTPAQVRFFYAGIGYYDYWLAYGGASEQGYAAKDARAFASEAMGGDQQKWQNYWSGLQANLQQFRSTFAPGGAVTLRQMSPAERAMWDACRHGVATNKHLATHTTLLTTIASNTGLVAKAAARTVWIQENFIPQQGYLGSAGGYGGGLKPAPAARPTKPVPPHSHGHHQNVRERGGGGAGVPRPS